MTASFSCSMILRIRFPPALWQGLPRLPPSAGTATTSGMLLREDCNQCQAERLVDVRGVKNGGIFVVGIAPSAVSHRHAIRTPSATQPFRSHVPVQDAAKCASRSARALGCAESRHAVRTYLRRKTCRASSLSFDCMRFRKLLIVLAVLWSLNARPARLCCSGTPVTGGSIVGRLGLLHCHLEVVVTESCDVLLTVMRQSSLAVSLW